MLPILPMISTTDAVTMAAGVLVVAVFVVAGREWVGRLRHRRLLRGACWITVLAPPEVDPHGAVMFWRAVLGLCLPSRWRDRLAGTPHVVFEYRFSTAGVEIGVWVPGTVSASLVASAIRSAWPGSHTHISFCDPQSDPPPAPPGPGRDRERRAVAGGVLCLARPDTLPLADDPPGDPVRALLAAPGRLGPGQWARVQVLARPVPAARMARAAASAARGGRGHGAGPLPLRLPTALAFGLVEVVAAVVTELVSALVPGGPSSHRPAASRASTARPARSGPGPQRVMDAAADRAVAGKLGAAAGGYRVTIRYAAATPVEEIAGPDDE
ncbi:hypothetical protein [Pseudonocardia sp. HH130630-07]|uniref:hypothetical protein n=1 Tax=Pseudonocardia sp. HH130630-07 TaxID=1690815 RepID=UPI0012EAAAC8|nr:hypothetical protein [Pseudonocardia sp. HH130630-07]